MELRTTYSYNPDPKLKRIKMPDTESVRTDLEGIARKFKVENIGFVFDMYSMLMSSGRSLMSRDKARKYNIPKLEKLGIKYMQAYRKTQNQWALFNKIKKMPYFSKLCSVKDKLGAVERLLAIFQKLAQRSQPAKCNACPLLKKCPFGNQVKNGGTPDYTKKFDSDCPEPPSITDPVLFVAKAIALLIAMTDPVQGQALLAELEKTDRQAAKLIGLLIAINKVGGPTKEFDTTFTGEQLVEAIENAVDSFTEKQMAVFELARTFNEFMLPEGEKEKEEVDFVSNDQKPREIRATEELAKAYPGETVDDDMMDKKLALGELQVRQDMQRKRNKQFFHIILDVSGSMVEPISPNVYALHTKGTFASALVLSVIKKVSLENGTLLFRFFAGMPDRLRISNDYDAFADLARLVGIADFNGSGTNIADALICACNDIITQHAELGSKAEILLVSDGECSQVVHRKAEIKNLIDQHKIKLHVLDVSPGGHSSAGKVALQGMSASYLQVNPNDINLKNVADNSYSKPS